MGHVQRDPLGTQLLKQRNPCEHLFPNLWVEALSEVVLGDSDSDALERAFELGVVVRNGDRGGGRVIGIVTRHYGHQYGGVCNILCQRPDAIERGSKGDKSVSRYASVCRHHPRDAAAGSRLTYRASRVGSQRRHRQSCRHGGCRASAGASGNPVDGNWIPYRTVCRVLVRAAHGKLVAVRLAEDYGTGALESPDGGGIVGRNVGLENLGTAGCGDVAGADDVLDGDGNAG